MSTTTYKIDFEEIKRAVSMEQLISYLALGGLKRRGSHQ